MLPYPKINPVFFHLGPIQFHWYGLMYVLGILGALFYTRLRIKHQKINFSYALLDDLIFYIALGIILGGRMGYCFFYGFSSMLAEPSKIFRIWEGGMSFHGGLIGVGIALWLFSRIKKIRFLFLADLAAVAVPIGLAFGRLGNFINGELWGRPTQLPWGMIFPGSDGLSRHPSQLYEFFLEGVVLFVLMAWFSRKPRGDGALSGLFLIFYGLFRFLLEYVREPDSHLGFLWLNLTMGQWLSLPMIVFGIILSTTSSKRVHQHANLSQPAQ